MSGNKPSTATGWTDPDEAPDLSAPDYRAKLAATAVQRGRPKSESSKVRIGFRLSADLVEDIRASGKGYNARVEQALRRAGFGAAESMGKEEPQAEKRARLAKNRRAPTREAGKSAFGKKLA